MYSFFISIVFSILIYKIETFKYGMIKYVVICNMKERITITLDKDLLKWLDSRIEEKVFANRSHGLEFLIKRKIEQETGIVLK